MLVSEKIQASLKYFKGICFEALGLSNEAYENYINAYKLAPESKQYLDKACISYYFLGDDKYSGLKTRIESQDGYNVFCWAIDTIESENPLEFIKNSVSKIVLDKNHYKRIVFNSNLKNNKVDIIKLIEVLEVSKISSEFPDSINYDNLHHWVFILNTLSIQFFTSCEIPFWGYLEKNEKSIQFLELSRLLSKAIKESELDKGYNVIVFNYYWLQSEIDIQEKTLHNLKDAYGSLKEVDAFRTMLIANAIQKHENIKNAFKIIDEFQGELDENIISLKTFCQLDNPQTEDTVLEYFSYIKYINELNAQNICSYLIPIIKSNIIEKKKLSELIMKINFSKVSYQELLLLLIDTLYLKELPIKLELVNNIKEKLLSDSKLFFFISLLYFENKFFVECIKFQETYVVEEKESRDLFLYIRALDSIKNTSQLKLLRLLKKWRTSFTFNDYLLRIEIELQQILKDWQEIELITEYGLSQLPNDEPFYTLYIISLAINGKISDLGKEINKIEHFNFVSTENALRIASILVQSNYLEAGLEIIYKKAVNRDDSLARMNYFSLTVNFPPEYFKDLSEVFDDCYVKFEIDGEVEIIHVNSKTKTLPIVQKSMGKSVLETFTIENNLSRKFKHVRILRVMNKYLALSDDILTEANSSFSNLPVESIKFESTDIKSFEKALIENFGAAEEERRKHTEKNFKEYHNYNLSLTELTNANFGSSYIDAYYHLVSNQSEGFFIKPLKYFNKSIGFESKKLIIDFSSGLLFYELSEKLGISFNKFLVSGNIYSIIENLISKTEAQRNSKMSVNFYNNKIIPHFYPENFHDNRIVFLQKLKKWFQKIADSAIPEEKLELIRPLYSDGKMTNTLEYIVDNAFLAQRENHIFITDDIGYEKMLKINNWSTTEKFLLSSFPDKKNEILEVLLSYRYVGLTVNSELLYTSYINQNKEGYSHIYNYALRNLSLPVNFNSFNIFIVVDFLKKLALNPTLTNKKYKYDATNVLAMLISSFPNLSFSFTLKTRIEQQFHLMGDYLNLTLTALLDALRINTPI